MSLEAVRIQILNSLEEFSIFNSLIKFEELPEALIKDEKFIEQCKQSFIYRMNSYPNFIHTAPNFLKDDIELKALIRQRHIDCAKKDPNAATCRDFPIEYENDDEVFNAYKMAYIINLKTNPSLWNHVPDIFKIDYKTLGLDADLVVALIEGWLRLLSKVKLQELPKNQPWSDKDYSLSIKDIPRFLRENDDFMNKAKEYLK
jgi:hypothetical protein